MEDIILRPVCQTAEKAVFCFFSLQHVLKWNRLSQFHIKVYRHVSFFFFFLISSYLTLHNSVCLSGGKLWSYVCVRLLKIPLPVLWLVVPLDWKIYAPFSWRRVDTFCKCVACFPNAPASSLTGVNQCDGERLGQRSSLLEDSSAIFSDLSFSTKNLKRGRIKNKICQWNDQIKAPAHSSPLRKSNLLSKSLENNT